MGNSRFKKEARRGDVIITISCSKLKSKRATVYAPEPLLLRKDTGRVTHLFVEEYADREETAIPFSKFRSLWSRLASTLPPTTNTTREVAVEFAEMLRQIWRA